MLNPIFTHICQKVTNHACLNHLVPHFKLSNLAIKQHNMQLSIMLNFSQCHHQQVFPSHSSVYKVILSITSHATPYHRLEEALEEINAMQCNTHTQEVFLGCNGAQARVGIHLNSRLSYLEFRLKPLHNMHNPLPIGHIKSKISPKQSHLNYKTKGEISNCTTIYKYFFFFSFFFHVCIFLFFFFFSLLSFYLSFLLSSCFFFLFFLYRTTKMEQNKDLRATKNWTRQSLYKSLCTPTPNLELLLALKQPFSQATPNLIKCQDMLQNEHKPNSK